MHWGYSKQAECSYPAVVLPHHSSFPHPIFQSTFIHLFFSPPASTILLQVSANPARTPKGSDQHCFKASRVQWVQQVVTWVQLLLTHWLEQPHEHFPQARSLSFAQIPLGQYHCKGKECWNKQNFERVKHGWNTLLLWPKRSAKWNWDLGAHRAASSSPPSVTLGSCDINTLRSLVPKILYIYISPPALHIAVTWLTILLGFYSRMCSRLL